MIVFFALSLAAWLAISFYSIVVKKRVIGLNLFVLTGIYIPMLFYSFGWSIYSDTEISESFFLIFFYLNLCMLAYNLLVKDDICFTRMVLPQITQKVRIRALNVAFIALFFIESYLGSGSFAPALIGIDIHAYSAPGIAFITRNLFVFVLANVIAWMVTRKKEFLIWAAILLIIPVTTRTMRISVFVTLLQVGAMLVAYYASSRAARTGKLNKTSKRSSKNAFVAGLIALFVLVLISQSSLLTNTRMNQYGKYDLSYDTTIGYIGPEQFNELLSVYYGYFPMSFNNLNLSLKYGSTEPNWIGLYSYKAVYFGLFQFDNLFELNPSYPDLVGRVSSSPAANVPTAFWDYWFDYREFCIIPIAIMVAICGWLTKRAQSKPTIFLYSQYYYFIPLVFFQSFQNLFYSSSVVFEVLIAFIVFNLAFKDSKRLAVFGRSGKRMELDKDTIATNLPKIKEKI